MKLWMNYLIFVLGSDRNSIKLGNLYSPITLPRIHKICI